MTKLNKAVTAAVQSLIDAGLIDRDNSKTAAQCNQFALGEGGTYCCAAGDRLQLRALRDIRVQAFEAGDADVAYEANRLLAELDPNDNGWQAQVDVRYTPDGEAEVYIYGNIGESWDGSSVSAMDLVDAINQIESDYITVRINSAGGSVPDGLAIYNALRRHPAAVTTVVDGWAASSASLILMAGDTVEMGANTLMMVHAPWTLAIGNSRDMRELADILDKWAQAMASSYVQQSGKTTEEILGLLTDGEDHWYTADEAKAEGFIDAVVAADQADLAASFTLPERFVARAPARIAAALTPFNAPRKQEKRTMTRKTDPGAAPENTNVVDIQDAAAKAERDRIKQRNAELRAAAKPFLDQPGAKALLDEAIDDPDAKVEDFNAKLLNVLGNNTAPAGAQPHIEAGETEAQKFAKGATAAIMARAGMAQDDVQNEFRGFTLGELARTSLVRAGVAIDGMDRKAIVGAAFTHTSSDFTHLLADVAHKSLMKGAEEAAETFEAWTTRGILTDFKPTHRVDLGTFGNLVKIPEGGEYQYGTIGDSGEVTQLATFGKLFSITRQAIINDDLGAFTRIPRLMGRAAPRTVGNLVYAVLTGNPVMADGVALFHANHNNLLTGAGITTTSVDAMRTAMGTQKDGDAILNIQLANLLVPRALEGQANVVRDSQYEVGATSKNNTVPNSVRGTFEVIADARLDADSPTAWYGAAAPGMHDTIEVSYLDGNSAPRLEQQDGWKVDGVEFKVALDAAVKALSSRTLAKNPGA